MTDQSKDIKPDATQLAAARNFLAYERTLMAWTRTSVSLISFGFTLFKFFQYIVEHEPGKHVDHVLGPKTIGAVMIGIGTSMLLLASVMHRKQLVELRKSYPETPFSQSLILAVLITILGLMMLAAVLLGG
jgi:putative membrane protein